MKLPFFRCRHPANMLAVLKDHTEEPSKEFPDKFTIVTYHFRCVACGEAVTVEYAKPLVSARDWIRSLKGSRRIQDEIPGIQGRR